MGITSLKPPRGYIEESSRSAPATSKYHPPRQPYKPSLAIERLASKFHSNVPLEGGDNGEGKGEGEGMSGSDDRLRRIDEVDDEMGLEKEKWVDKFALLTKVCYLF